MTPYPNNIYFISVESRKGGVGKTTSALVLSQALLDERFQVLYLDLDITGTRLNTGFAKKTNLQLTEVKLGGEPANLLTVFYDLYLQGKGVTVKTGAVNKEILEVENGKVNVLGSDIFVNLDKKDKVGHGTVVEPAVLYDSFHAYWMLEMIIELSKSFARCFDERDNVAVILDNPPGYSSLESLIHDYLTDLGPEYGKFLFVSSLDTQDLDACEKTIDELKSLHSDKKHAGAFYNKQIETPWQSYKGDVSKIESAAFKKAFDTLLNERTENLPPVLTKDSAPSDVNYYIGLLLNKVIGDVKGGKICGLEPRSVPFLRHMHTLFWSSEDVFSEWGSTFSELDRKMLKENKFRVILDEIKERDNEFIKRITDKPYSSFFKSSWTVSEALSLVRTACVDCGLSGTEREPATFDKLQEDSVDQCQDYEDSPEINFAIWYASSLTDEPGKVQTILSEYIDSAKLYYAVTSSNYLWAEDKPPIWDNNQYAEFIDRFIDLVRRLYFYNVAYKLFNSLIDSFEAIYGQDEIVDKEEIVDLIDHAFEGKKAFDNDLENKLREAIAKVIDFSVLKNQIKKVLGQWGIR